MDRRFKKEGQPEADFPNIVAFGKTAEFVEKYFRKGQRIGLTGRIQTGSYTNNDGVKIYTTDVIAEEVEFVESKASSEGREHDPSQANGPTPDSDGFLNIPEGDFDEFPFN